MPTSLMKPGSFGMGPVYLEEFRDGMFGAGFIADDGDGGADTAEIAERFFKHVGSHLRDRLHAKRLILGLNEIGVLVGEGSALRGAAVFKLLHFVKPHPISVKARQAAVRAAASLDFLIGHAGHFSALFLREPDIDASLVHAAGLSIDHRGLAGQALLGGPQGSCEKHGGQNEEPLFHLLWHSRR